MPLNLLSGLFDKPWPFVVDQVPVRLVVEIDPACPCSASSPVGLCCAFPSVDNGKWHPVFVCGSVPSGIYRNCMRMGDVD